ncbi:hypothetical protein [Nostocoides vanveenii]|uniref:Alanine racemase N-terminal domain-containing protein n=1 Tax=Nostocoides vanveenii TaxID=330835 RepID=A0ABN2KQ55_9MICO
MAYAVREALWLADHGARDLFVAYPSVDEAAIARLAGDGAGGAAYVDVVTLAIDSVEQVALIRRACPGLPIRVAIDVDASLRLGPVHLGVRRSPVRTREQAVLVARAAQSAGLASSG